MKGKLVKKIVVCTLAVSLLGGGIGLQRVFASENEEVILENNIKEVFEEEEEEKEENISETENILSENQLIGTEPIYDAEKIYREAKEIGVGYAEGYNPSAYSNARWSGGDERYAGKIISAADSGIKIDIVTYNPTVIHHSWKEGVLGFKDRNDPNNTSKQERAFCADPSRKFRGGTFVCQPMEEVYNYKTLQLVGAMLKYIDDNPTIEQHLGSTNMYALRQCAVWSILNTVEGWYEQSVYFEFGNNVHCLGDSSCYISNHVSDVMNTGWNWAFNHYQYITPKDCYYWHNKNNSSRQPLCTFNYEYDDTNWLAIQKKPSSYGGYVNGVWYDDEAYAKYAINGNPAYSLEGAKYTAWNADTGEYYYDAITTDKYGYGWCYLPSGKYQIQESVPPKGYIRDTTWYDVDLQTTNYTFEHPEPIKTARIKLQKKDEDGNVKPDMAGAVYGIWNWEGEVGNGNPVWTITVDSNGFGEVWGLPLWKYYVKEISAPEGYELDTNVYTVDLSKEGSTNEISYTVNSKEPIKNVRIDLSKKSNNGSITNGNSNYSLEGAEYTVYSDEALKNKVGVIITDKNGNGFLDGLKIGTYYIKETKPSLGFNLDETVHKIEAK